MNNFQQLEEKKMNEYPNSTKDVKKRVDKTMDIYRFVGNIFDLYFPKIVGYVTTMLGGDSKTAKSSRYPNRP